MCIYIYIYMYMFIPFKTSIVEGFSPSKHSYLTGRTCTYLITLPKLLHTLTIKRFKISVNGKLTQRVQGFGWEVCDFRFKV